MEIKQENVLHNEEAVFNLSDVTYNSSNQSEDSFSGPIQTVKSGSIHSPEENIKSSSLLDPIEIEIQENNMNYDKTYIVKYDEIGVLVIHDSEKDFKRTVFDLLKEQHDIVFENEELMYFEAFHPKFKTNYTVTESNMPGEGIIYLKHRPRKK